MARSLEDWLEEIDPPYPPPRQITSASNPSIVSRNSEIDSNSQNASPTQFISENGSQQFDRGVASRSTQNENKRIKLNVLVRRDRHLSRLSRGGSATTETSAVAESQKKEVEYDDLGIGPEYEAKTKFPQERKLRKVYRRKPFNPRLAGINERWNRDHGELQDEVDALSIAAANDTEDTDKDDLFDVPEPQRGSSKHRSKGFRVVFSESHRVKVLRKQSMSPNKRPSTKRNLFKEQLEGLSDLNVIEKDSIDALAVEIDSEYGIILQKVAEAARGQWAYHPPQSVAPNPPMIGSSLEDAFAAALFGPLSHEPTTQDVAVLEKRTLKTLLKVIDTYAEGGMLCTHCSTIHSDAKKFCASCYPVSTRGGTYSTNLFVYQVRFVDMQQILNRLSLAETSRKWRETAKILKDCNLEFDLFPKGCDKSNKSFSTIGYEEWGAYGVRGTFTTSTASLVLVQTSRSSSPSDVALIPTTQPTPPPTERERSRSPSLILSSSPHREIRSEPQVHQEEEQGERRLLYRVQHLWFLSKEHLGTRHTEQEILRHMKKLSRGNWAFLKDGHSVRALCSHIHPDEEFWNFEQPGDFKGMCRCDKCALEWEVNFGVVYSELGPDVHQMDINSQSSGSSVRVARVRTGGKQKSDFVPLDDVKDVEGHLIVLTTWRDLGMLKSVCDPRWTAHFGKRYVDGGYEVPSDHDWAELEEEAQGWELGGIKRAFEGWGGYAGAGDFDDGRDGDEVEKGCDVEEEGDLKWQLEEGSGVKLKYLRGDEKGFVQPDVLTVEFE